MNIQEIIKSGKYQLIDVREPEEIVSYGEIKNAKNIPLRELEKRKEEILKLKGHIIFFCRSGIRSEKAVEFFANEGISNIYNGGGYDSISQMIKD